MWSLWYQITARLKHNDCNIDIGWYSWSVLKYVLRSSGITTVTSDSCVSHLDVHIVHINQRWKQHVLGLWYISYWVFISQSRRKSIWPVNEHSNGSRTVETCRLLGWLTFYVEKGKKKDACKITLSPCCLHERINLPAWACSNLILSFLGSKEPEECVWNVTFHMQIPENAVFGQ